MSPTEGAEIAFTDTSEDADLDVVCWAWDFGDGTVIPPVCEQNPSHTYEDNGQYQVTLTVTDAAGLTSTASQEVAVGNAAPAAHAGGPYGASWDVPIFFSGGASDPSPVDTEAGFSYHWDFGDGATSYEQNPSHAYATPGMYAATLAVTDKDNGVGMATAVVVVSERPSTITNEGPFTGQYSDPVTVAARLLDGIDGSSIQAAGVELSIGGQVAPTAITDDTGVAAAQIVVNQVAGSVNVSALFPGNDRYIGSYDGDQFTILKESSILAYTGDQIVPYNGSSIILRASVTEETDGYVGGITRASVLFDVYRALGDSLAPMVQCRSRNSAGVGVAVHNPNPR
jgi:PKD repeat protein